MPRDITEEIIDAILQNEGHPVERSLGGRPAARPPRAPRNQALLKPDWGQLPPNAVQFPADRDPVAGGYW